MTRRAFTDRSRIVTYQRCNRRRWYEYHEGGRGISPVKTPLPLAVGGSVHEGLASLLRDGMNVPNAPTRAVEDCAVQTALADFSQYTSALQIDTSEADAIAQATVAAASADQAAQFGEEFASQVRARVESSVSDFDRYLADEQRALVEAMVRAYARRRLRPLLEEFEVLEVEREGSWLLADWFTGKDYAAPPIGETREVNELIFNSRPDALLRERSTNELYLLSYKTAAAWDIRKARDAEHDMQGLSEGIEIEQRLANWWNACHNVESITMSDAHDMQKGDVSPRIMEYLKSLDAPPRIHAVRYEYLLKGERRRDKDLTARFGFEARSQASSLVRGYRDPAGKWCYSWDYLKPDGSGETSKLNYRTWRGAPVWEDMPIADWIDKLADSAMAVSGETGGELGYGSDAQSLGYTATHPLDDVFIPPIVIYRQEDALRDLVEQMEAQETRVAQAVVEVESTTDAAERRRLLNVHFPQALHSCEWPSTCAFTKICFGGEHIQSDPFSSGLYKQRVPNHPQEVQNDPKI